MKDLTKLDNCFSGKCNTSLMATPAKTCAFSVVRRSPAFRFLSLAVLVVSLGIEVLSCSFVESVAIPPAERSGRAFTIETLQLCDNHYSLGALFDVPVILSGALCFEASPVARRYHRQVAVFVPDGFRRAIDHPPQSRA